MTAADTFMYPSPETVSVKSQSDLANDFKRGETHGQASNVAIRETAGGYTLLVGYGHAVYAARSPDGYIVTYTGWYGYSPSTSCQFTRMGLKGMADHCIDDMPKTISWEPKGLRPADA